MALQPIYNNGDIIDYYDDGLSEEHPPASIQEPELAQSEDSHEEPGEGDEPAQAPRTWSVPTLLKGTNDLFIGTTVHHDDGDPQGPLISLFAREQPDGMIHVKTFRAAELSQRAFLDNLQKAIAATMQVHFLAWADRQRKKVEEEAKRKARANASTAKSVPPAHPAVTGKSSASTVVPASTAQESANRTSNEAEKKPEKKYATISMFE